MKGGRTGEPRALASKLDQLRFGDPKRRQDVADEREGGDQRSQAILVFRPLHRRA